MAYRLVMAIIDVVRRATRKRITGREEELGDDAQRMVPGWSADQLRGVLGEDILAELMASADWPVMARRLAGLRNAVPRDLPRRAREREIGGPIS